jgi:hypothetical protein
VLLAYLFFGAISFSTIWQQAIVADRYGIVVMCNGTARSPFARRVLVPALVKIIDRGMPDVLEERIQESFTRSLDAAEQPPNGQDIHSPLSERTRGHESVVAIAMLLKYLSLVAFLFALRYAIRTFYGPAEVIADFGPLFSLLFLPVFGGFGNFIYDYAQLALFTFSLILLAKKHWTAYYIVFTLAILNKETAILLPLLFAIAMRSQIIKREYWIHLTAQVALYTAVTLFLVLSVRNSPGSIVEFYMKSNMMALSSIHSYFDFQKIGPCLLAPGGFSIAVPVGLNLLIWVPFSIIMFLFWREKPRFLRLALWTVLIPLALLALFFGVATEIRVLYEAFPIAFLLVFHSLARMWQIDVPLTNQILLGDESATSHS